MMKTYKEFFDNIHLDKNIDKIILNKTIYKKNNVMLKKVIVTLSVLLIISITSIGIVYADELIEKIKSLFITTTIDFDKGGYSIYLDQLKFSNKKELNFDAKFSNVEFPVLDNQQKISFDELEQNLDIEILTSRFFENDIARIIKLEKNNEKISHGQFAFDNIYVFKNDKKTSKISMSIEFITKFYEKDYFEITLGQTLDKNRIYKSVELNEKLNTEVYFWGTKAITNDDENIGTLRVTFVYEDIIYTLTGYDVSKSDIINLIESLEY